MSSRFIHIVVLHSFLWLNYIPSYGETTICLYIRLVDIGVVSTFWLLQVVPLWTFMYKFLRGHLYWFPLDVYRGVELLGYVVTVFSFWRNCQTVSMAAAPFTSPPAIHEGSSCSTSSPVFVSSMFFGLYHPNECKLIVVFSLHFPKD